MNRGVARFRLAGVGERVLLISLLLLGVSVGCTGAASPGGQESTAEASPAGIATTAPPGLDDGATTAASVEPSSMLASPSAPDSSPSAKPLSSPRPTASSTPRPPRPSPGTTAGTGNGSDGGSGGSSGTATTVKVTGRATAGPICPVERIPPDPQCAPRPVSGAVLVVNRGDARLMAVTTDSNGDFAVLLEPGDYTLVPQPVPGLMGTAPPIRFSVPASGKPPVLALAYDTGIR